MKVLLAHPGTQYSHQLARQLFKRNILFEFHTGIAYGKDHWSFKVLSKLPKAVFKKISNRFIDEVPDKYIQRYFFNELKEIMNIKLGFDEEKCLYRRNNNFQKKINAKSIAAADVVIGFDTSSLILIQRCRQLTKPFILDVSIGHPVSKKEVYQKIAHLYPDWNFTLKQKAAHQVENEEQEMKLADHIVVASSFTLGTYVAHGVAEKKISINPYGVDAVKLKPALKDKNKGLPLSFVFVGLADARKGIPLLLDTWKACNVKACTLTLIGPISDTAKKFIHTNFPGIIVRGRISYIELMNELPHFDVMIFPSFFEGFGLVIPEAMACGLPVISTTATCAPDMYVDRLDGFIINPYSSDSLKNAIEYFIEHPEKATEMGLLARDKAAGFTWDVYGENWEKIVDRIKDEYNSGLLPQAND